MKKPVEIQRFLEDDGMRGQLIVDVIDAYRRFAETLDKRNRFRTSHGNSLISYNPFSGQGRILAEIARGGGVSQVLVSEGLGITPQTASIAIRKLEANGLVRRVQSEIDRREKLLYLTEAGEEAYQRLKQEDQYSGSVFEALETEEMQSFLHCLEKLSVWLENEMESTSSAYELVDSAEAEGFGGQFQDVASFPKTGTLR